MQPIEQLDAASLRVEVHAVDERQRLLEAREQGGVGWGARRLLVGAEGPEHPCDHLVLEVELGAGLAVDAGGPRDLPAPREQPHPHSDAPVFLGPHGAVAGERGGGGPRGSEPDAGLSRDRVLQGERQVARDDVGLPGAIEIADVNDGPGLEQGRGEVQLAARAVADGSLRELDRASRGRAPEHAVHALEHRVRVGPSGALSAEHGEHELGDVPGDGRVHGARIRRGAREPSDRERERAGPREREGAGEQLEQHHPQRVDVGATVERGALDLLGRHVRGRPEDGVHRHQRIAGTFVALRDAGDPEVGDSDTGADEHHVRGLEVPVDDPGDVRRGEPARDLRSDTQHLTERERGARAGRQRRAEDQLHRREAQLSVVAEVVGAHDVGVGDAAGELNLPAEPRDSGLVRGELRPQRLERDVLVELAVARAIHRPHPPGAQERADLEAPREHPPGLQRGEAEGLCV